MNSYYHYFTITNFKKNKNPKWGRGILMLHLCTCLLSNPFMLFLLGKHTGLYPHSEFLSSSGNTHVVRSQRHAASTAGTEFGTAVGAEMAAPISKLRFMTDSTSWSIIFMLTLVTPRFFPYFPHLFLIAFKLLMQSPGKRENGNKLSK